MQMLPGITTSTAVLKLDTVANIDTASGCSFANEFGVYVDFRDIIHDHPNLREEFVNLSTQRCFLCRIISISFLRFGYIDHTTSSC